MGSASQKSVFSGEDLRESMRLVPSPVTVIVGGSGEQTRGITIGSFTSTSLDPPLITFNVSKGANFHDLIEDGLLLAVHLLADDQAELSNRFAIPDLTSAEQFANLDASVDSDGLTVLKDTLGIFTCRVAANYLAGDHTIVVARVLSFVEGRDGSPLIYQNQSYHAIKR